jgi:hypothetical protein
VAAAAEGETSAQAADAPSRAASTATDRPSPTGAFAVDRMPEAARACGPRGAYGLGDLSWRVAVVAEPELAEGLLSVREYLKTGRHIREVARSADVHVDTVRYRLRPGGTRAGDASAGSGSPRV